MLLSVIIRKYQSVKISYSVSGAVVWHITTGLCAGVALEFRPTVTNARLFDKDKYLEPMFGDVGQARTKAAILLPMIATTSSRTCTKPIVVRSLFFTLISKFSQLLSPLLILNSNCHLSKSMLFYKCIVHLQVQFLLCNHKVLNNRFYYSLST